jgi:large subunit ribosomal protein L13
MKKISRKKVEIDATDQAPGRLASKIASILIGKTKVGYLAHIDSGDKVIVHNVDQLRFSGKKLDQKVYRHHSMHPGGLKEIPAKKVMKEKPEEIIRHAVMRMLPKNKLRTSRMLRLKFK